MNISLNKEDFSIDNVYFYEPIKNSIIDYIKSIEIEILEKINIERKKKIYKINEQLMTGYIKHLIDNKYANCFILKISGIWESENEYGLTFKFIEINHL